MQRVKMQIGTASAFYFSLPYTIVQAILKAPLGEQYW
jgi:hypothetical protein